MAEPLLDIRNLVTAFEVEGRLLTAVDGVSFSIKAGGTLGIVGESGCGKSVSAMSVIRLLPQPMGRILSGEVHFAGRDLLKIPIETMRDVRGKEIGVIFQEPMTALNPVQRIGWQMAEMYLRHTNMSKKEAWEAGIEMMRKVRIPAPEIRAADYPHQLSGGMRQRAVIAMALSLNPKLVIADEPTTALDVTVQAQILDLMRRMQEEQGTAMILITHDLGVIAETCEDVVVMYAGRIVEKAPANEIFAQPRHAYTKGLLASMPDMERKSKSLLPVIPGLVGSLDQFVAGCRFCQRMGRSGETLSQRPVFEEISPGHWVEHCPVCVS